MKKKFPELDKFKKLLNRFDKQLNVLQKENQERKEEYKKLDSEYNQMVVEEATTGEPIDKVKLNRITKRKKSIERDMEQFADRIKIIKNTREEMLKERLPEVKEGFQRAAKELNDEIREELTGIIPAAMPYIKHLQKIGELNKTRIRMFEEFMSAAKVIDKDYEQKHYRFSSGERVDLSLFADGYGTNPRVLGLTEDEQQATISQGGLPSRYALYETTGEIETEPYKAQQKYYKTTNKVVKTDVEDENEKELSVLQKEIKELEHKRTDAMYKKNHKLYKELSTEIGKLTDRRMKLRGIK